jgi:hypothetical protein
VIVPISSDVLCHIDNGAYTAVLKGHGTLVRCAFAQDNRIDAIGICTPDAVDIFPDSRDIVIRIGNIAEDKSDRCNHIMFIVGMIIVKRVTAAHQGHCEKNCHK